MNKRDIRWYVVRTRREYAVKRSLDEASCVKETYLPLKQEDVLRDGKVPARTVLSLPGFVFARANYRELRYFLACNLPDTWLELGIDNTPERPMTIPDEDMQHFKAFNESSLPLLWLRDPYQSFAKNDRVRILTGPFAGYEGFIKEIKHDLKLVFRFGIWAIAISCIHRYDVAVIANAPARSEVALLVRLADYFTDKLQTLGSVDNNQKLLREIISGIGNDKAIAAYRNEILGREKLSDERTVKLAFLQSLSPEDEASLMQMARYLCGKEPAPVLERAIPDAPLRPFLTLSPGVAMQEGEHHAIIRHRDFIEWVVPTDMEEGVYDAGTDSTRMVTHRYYAHIGIFETGKNTYTLITNWTSFYAQYNLKTKEEKEKLLTKLEKAGIRTFHDLLTENTSSEIRFRELTPYSISGLSLTIRDISEMEAAVSRLLETGKALCEEIRRSSRLRAWQNALSTVWVR